MHAMRRFAWTASSCKHFSRTTTAQQLEAAKFRGMFRGTCASEAYKDLQLGVAGVQAAIKASQKDVASHLLPSALACVSARAGVARLLLAGPPACQCRHGSGELGEESHIDGSRRSFDRLL